MQYTYTSHQDAFDSQIGKQKKNHELICTPPLAMSAMNASRGLTIGAALRCRFAAACSSPEDRGNGCKDSSCGGLGRLGSLRLPVTLLVFVSSCPHISINEKKYNLPWSQPRCLRAEVHGAACFRLPSWQLHCLLLLQCRGPQH
jgi:hypothetical protein